MDWHHGISDVEMAEIANATYTGGAREVHGWTRDEDKYLTGPNSDTVVWKKGGKAVVSYRGSEFNANDWKTNVGIIATGLQDYGSKFKRGVRTADRVSAKYGEGNVHLVGHSQGGAIAAHVSRKRGHKATALSAAMNPLRGGRTYKNTQFIQTRKDPIAFGAQYAKGGKNTTVKQTRWNPHTVNNFRKFV